MNRARVRQLVDEIDAELRAHARPERAESEKAYLKSELAHYGCSVPAIRSTVKTAVKAAAKTADGGLGHDEVVAAAAELWRPRVHERRMAAIELLDLCSSVLEPADSALIERFLRESKTWALVDGLAASVVGALVDRHPDHLAPVLERWAGDGDFWVRRSALLAHLVALRRGDGDFDRFTRYADAMLDEKEFFVRKAIGWVLRDTARKRPDMVFEWLLPRAGRASSVTIREAVKPLSEQQRAEILARR